MAKVLIVDDSYYVRQILNYLLVKENYEVDTCENGLKAVEQYKPGVYQAVLMDYTMPGLDGVGAISYIRQKDSEVKLIMVSAMIQNHVKKKAFAAGADDFLGKPYKQEDLLAILQKHLPQTSGK